MFPPISEEEQKQADLLKSTVNAVAQAPQQEKRMLLKRKVISRNPLKSPLRFGLGSRKLIS